MPLVGICSFKDGKEKRLKIILRINFIYEFEKIIQKEESCCLGCLLKLSLSLKIYTATKTKVPIDSFGLLCPFLGRESLVAFVLLLIISHWSYVSILQGDTCAWPGICNQHRVQWLLAKWCFGYIHVTPLSLHWSLVSYWCSEFELWHTKPHQLGTKMPVRLPLQL